MFTLRACWQGFLNPTGTDSKPIFERCRASEQRFCDVLLNRRQRIGILFDPNVMLPIG
jgi:hypothetical protein